MRYAFGVEYFEIGLGNEIERRLAADHHNERGWHGNAVLFRTEPERLALIRLEDDGLWFGCEESLVSPRLLAQPRVGGRCAVAAILATKGGRVCVVSTHLESGDAALIRLSQMERLLAAIEAFAPGIPVVIGGDLNTGSTLEEGEQQREPLFRAAERRGYCWDGNPAGATTRNSPLNDCERPGRKLDWFCSRGLATVSSAILQAVDERGTVLSDHEPILASFTSEPCPSADRAPVTRSQARLSSNSSR
jgi:endonuclease/exonuclease/phosphatase family metal-dependent hydrolase